MSNPDRVLHLSGSYLNLILLVNSNETDWCECGLKRQAEQKRTEQQKGINKTIRKTAR